MPDNKPVVYILRGDDREAIETHIHNFYQSLGEAEIADLNFTHLEGGQVDLNDLRGAALALPFLTERRLVVLEDALKLVEGGGETRKKDQFLALLESLPTSTALVLVLPDSQKVRKRDGRWESYWSTLGQKHWLMLWADEAGGKVYIQDCPLPSAREMGHWIRNKAMERSGNFTIGAAQILADYVGNNTQRATQEIDKLLTYANFERPVDEDDVQRLGIQDRESDIFELVDSIGSRNGQKALDLLHLLLEEMSFGQLFSMVVRQFRLILQAREIMDAGGGEGDIAKILRLRSFVGQKIASQARKFDMHSLESIYYLLQKIDMDVKTSRVDGDVVLDMFIARLAEGLI